TVIRTPLRQSTHATRTSTAIVACQTDDPAATQPLFFFTAPATTEIYTLSLHDALPIFGRFKLGAGSVGAAKDCLAVAQEYAKERSEEHTSELQSRFDLVCRLLLEKKNQILTE